MLSGFNTNFRYRGVLFHVQTEDSGIENPHVITHLFYGGNIIASRKRDYSELLLEDDDALEDSVRKLMEIQHKSMLKGLSRGEHDAAIGERLGPDAFRVEGAAEPNPLLESDTDTGAPDPTGGKSPTSPEAGNASPAVAEPTVIVPEEADPSSGLARVFGDTVVSEKPLDEVVLDYLVENARKRRRQPK